MNKKKTGAYSYIQKLLKAPQAPIIIHMPEDNEYTVHWLAWWIILLMCVLLVSACVLLTQLL